MEKIRVMLAEDNEILRENFCDLIGGQPDMELAGAAATGAEAVRLCTELRPDILLLDIEMETMRAGLDAAAEIIRRDPAARIIFLTMHESDDMILGGMEAGAVDYIVKSDDEDKILAHIRNAYAGQVHLDPHVQTKLRQEVIRLKKSEISLLFFINNISRLTPAEIELIRLLLEGHKVAQIAEIRCVELITVKTQIKSLLRKFNCSRSKEIVELIREMNLEQLFFQKR